MIIVGKEFRIRSTKFLGTSVSATVSGGRPCTPMLLEASIAARQEVLEERRSHFNSLPAYVGMDLSIYYKWIRPGCAHQIKLDLFRLFDRNETHEAFVPEHIQRDGSFSKAHVEQLPFGQHGTNSTLLPIVFYKVTF